MHRAGKYVTETGDQWIWRTTFSAVPAGALVRELAALERRGEHVLTLNVDIFAQLRELPAEHRGRLAEAYTLVVADGLPVVWAARAAGRDIPGRVTGADLFPELTAALVARGGRVHVSGGPPGAADAAARALSADGRHRELIDTSAFSLSEDPDGPEYEVAAREILGRRPDVVFAGYGFPKQDYLGMAVRRIDPSVTVIGCGGAISFVAGRTPRAPSLLGRTGFEWLFRLTMEPRRLWRRYLLRDIPALPALFRSAIEVRVGWRRPAGH